MNSHTQPSVAADVDNLKNYIQQQLHTGLQPDEVASHLRQAGWPETYISQAFQAVQAAVVPAAFQPPAVPTASHGAPAGTEAAVLAAGSRQSAVQPPQPYAPAEAAPVQKRGRIKTGWLLFKQSWRILRSHTSLTRYVVMSLLSSPGLTAVFAAIFIIARHSLVAVSSPAGNSQDVQLTPAGYTVGFIYDVLAFFIVNLYTAGLVANLLDLFQGNSKPSVST